MAGLNWSIMARYKPMSYSSRCNSYGGDLAPVHVPGAVRAWRTMAHYYILSSNNPQVTVNLIYLLMLSGDVESNPGPTPENPEKVDICKICNENSTNQPADEALECDICQMWICFNCSGVLREIYNISTASDIPLDYICKPCKKQLPNIRDMVTIRKQFEELSERMKLEEERNKSHRREQVKVNQLYDKRLQDLENCANNLKLAENMENRIKKLEEEKIVPDDKIKTFAEAAFEKCVQEYPALTDQSVNFEKFKENNQKLLDDQRREIIAKQEKDLHEMTEDIRKGLIKSTGEEKHDIAEMKRRKYRENNLIFYNVLEDESANTGELMMKDFNKIKNLYEHKVPINPEDITAITRLGVPKQNTIRPIRIIFKEESKKTEVLRNNRDLIIEDDTLKICECENKTKHIHVYVSPDRTELQRKNDKKLSQELKRRKQAGETGLVIRNEKIVPFREMAQPSWASLFT